MTDREAAMELWGKVVDGLDGRPTFGDIADAILEAKAQEAERAVREVGGWTGPINTGENAHVVSEVCRANARGLRIRAAELRAQIKGER